MRVIAKLTRIDYNSQGQTRFLFKQKCMYQAFQSIDDGIIIVTDGYGNPSRFSHSEFNRMFEVVDDYHLTLSQYELDLVMNALSGSPTSTSSSFADKIEKILKQYVIKED